MLKSLRIRNYRVFKDIEVGGLERINLIAGKNNSGKTSLLEAIFLLSSGGNPKAVVDYNLLRLSGYDPAAPPRAPVEIMWQGMFNSMDVNSPIVISGSWGDSGSLELKVSVEKWEGADSVDLTERISTAHISAFQDKALTLRFKDPNNNIVEGQARFVSEKNIQPLEPNAQALFDAQIYRAQPRSIHNDSIRLARLRTQKQEGILLDALRIIEPDLQGVEDNSASGAPMIWGDIGLPELVPLPSMGLGMTCLARIILDICSTPGGIVLADEIENGFHHSAMDKVWKAIGCASERFDTQVFATTHSFECIQDAYKGLGEDGFRLHRLDSKDGDSFSVTYEPDELELVMRLHLEVR